MDEVWETLPYHIEHRELPMVPTWCFKTRTWKMGYQVEYFPKRKLTPQPEASAPVEERQPSV